MSDAIPPQRPRADDSRIANRPEDEQGPHADDLQQIRGNPHREGRAEAGDRWHGGSGSVLAPLIMMGALLLLVFSPACRLASQGLPRAPSGFAPPATGPQRATTTAIQAVPTGLPRDVRIRTAADVFPYAVAALGRPTALALTALMTSQTYVAGDLVGYGIGGIAYPYQYPVLNAVLDKAAPTSFRSGATALGAALTVLAAQPETGTFGRPGYQAIQNAAPAAYAVLNRARASGGCAPQLDLLLLLTADEGTSRHVLDQEERRTEATCPHDPTPAWLLDQAALRTVPLSISATHSDPHMVALLRAAIAVSRHLAAEYPDDTGVLSGLGDAYLLAGTHLRFSEPFTSRQDFRLAIMDYDRVDALGDKRDALPGLTRALTGLGEPARAAGLLLPLTRSAGFPGPFLEQVVTADEAAHDFAAAEAAAQRLGKLGTAAYPNGSALLPVPASNSVDSLDDASLPLSYGAGRLTPLTVELFGGRGAGGSVRDLSFIPVYRDDAEVTGTQPTCPSWTAIRDELLLGHPALALANWPTQFESVRPVAGYCGTADKLKLLAETEAGRKPDQASMKRGGITSDAVADAWQNLLRWAGDLPAAKKAAARWQAAKGDNSALPAVRLGEIDFLMHDYNAAAAEFGLAARRWRLVSNSDDLNTDQAQLDRGAALLATGRTAEAVQTLRPLDLTGTQGYSYQKAKNSSYSVDSDVGLQFAAISYYACEQLGDYESQSGNLHAAVEDYTNALIGYHSSPKDPVSGRRR